MATTTKLARTNDTAGKFTRGANAGTFTCDVCGKRRQVANREITSGKATGVCTDCFDTAGLENEHSDTNGEHNGNAPVHGCPECESVIVATAAKVVRNVSKKRAPKTTKATTTKTTPDTLPTCRRCQVNAVPAEHPHWTWCRECVTEHRAAKKAAKVAAAVTTIRESQAKVAAYFNDDNRCVACGESFRDGDELAETSRGVLHVACMTDGETIA